MLDLVVLFATVVLRAALSRRSSIHAAPRKRACPARGDNSRSSSIRSLRVLVPAVEHRWCLDCGWRCVVRVQSRVINRAARS